MDKIFKNISSILALITTVGYVALIMACTFLKVDVKYFDQYSILEMSVISFYFGASNKKEKYDKKDGDS